MSVIDDISGWFSNPDNQFTGSMVMQGFGAGYSAMAAYDQASTQQDALGYEAQVAANNAIIAGYQAQIARQDGATQEQNSRLQTAQIFGAQRAAMAANGIDLGEGSATDVLATTKVMGERDALTIRDNANQRAWAYENQANNYAAESQLTKMTADAISPVGSAFGSLLTGATGAAKTWYAYKRQTAGTPDIESVGGIKG